MLFPAPWHRGVPCWPLMQHNELLNTLPDFIALVRRDGVLLSRAGGSGLEGLRSATDDKDQPLDAVWPQELATLIRQLVRRSIAARTASEAKFHHHGVAYEVRATAQGPDRAVCVIRRALSTTMPTGGAPAGDTQSWRLERRDFKRQFKDSISLAVLRERPAAVAAIYVDGVSDVARIVDAEFAAKILSAAIARLAPDSTQSPGAEIRWYLGQLGGSLIAIVLESCDRERIDALVACFCQSLREPVARNDATFHLVAWAGVAILGQDATSPRLLLEHARSAANEARRVGTGAVQFFSDTMKLRALARLDIAHELRLAISNRGIRLRYVGRHDLASGRVVAAVGYLQWQDAFRGEVRAAEFVKVAETTGLARALSRAALERLGEDYASLRSRYGAEARISFGPLRHHVLHDQFLDDITDFLKTGTVPAAQFELRIGERFLATCDSHVLRSIAGLGVHLIVEDVGYGMSSLELMARAPIDGLQLGLSWITNVRRDPIARKLCHAAFSMAAALGLTSIAKGIDDREQRDVLLALGCGEGLGNLYGALENGIVESAAAS